MPQAEVLSEDAILRAMHNLSQVSCATRKVGSEISATSVYCTYYCSQIKLPASSNANALQQSSEAFSILQEINVSETWP